MRRREMLAVAGAAGALAAGHLSRPTPGHAADDPVVALYAEWRAKVDAVNVWGRTANADVPDEMMDPINDLQWRIRTTPATSPAGVAAKLRVWTDYNISTEWSEATAFRREPDIIGALRDLDRMAASA